MLEKCSITLHDIKYYYERNIGRYILEIDYDIVGLEMTYGTRVFQRMFLFDLKECNNKEILNEYLRETFTGFAEHIHEAFNKEIEKINSINIKEIFHEGMLLLASSIEKYYDDLCK